MPIKSVIFIRHAESVANLAAENALDSVAQILNFKVPSCENVLGGFKVLEDDPDITPLGQQQIDSARLFVERDECGLFRTKLFRVFHSPLIRAKKTCYGILNSKVAILDDFIEIPELVEATPFENVVPKTLHERINNFEQILIRCPDENIIVVGHGQYFHTMLSLDTRMRNCDMLEVKLLCDESTRTYKWYDHRQLFQSNISKPHFLETLSKSNKQSASAVTQTKPDFVDV